MAFTIVAGVLVVILIATALAVARLRALYQATMLMALFSLVTASLLILLDAPDVAFTEAAVGVGISTVLLLGVLALTRSSEHITPRRRRLPAAIVVVLTGGLLAYASLDLPGFGSANAPVQQHPVTEVYLQQSQSDTGVPNTVTAVLASYRGLDTLGELVVVFTAGVAVATLLGSFTRSPKVQHQVELVLAEYRVLRVMTGMLLPFILLFALYVLFHGDYGPGGGFQAGVIFASGFVLYGLVFGIDRVKRVLPDGMLWALVPLGLVIFLGLGVLTMVLGGAFLDYDALNPEHPKDGQHMGILIVEAAIGITVAMVMVAIFVSFAGRRAVR